MSPPIGELDTAILALEQRILQYVPGCDFFFGGKIEEELRAKSPPFVAWDVGEAEEAPPWEQSSTTHFAMVDDLVQITARCAGLIEAPGPDPRRQQHEAGRSVLNALRWAVKSLHQGKDNPLRTWRALSEVSSDYVVFEYGFTIRAGVMTPDQPDVQPLTQDITEVLT